MKMITRRADESILIGERLIVTFTDVDKSGVRLMIDGELIGGPDDGMALREARELAVGSELRLGSLITLTIVEVKGKIARVGVVAPAHIDVKRKEIAGPSNPAEDR